MAEALTETLLRDAEGKDALLIAGPTASGKSALAMAVAKAAGGVVINADSMQVYDRIRILTARPTVEEEAAVAHALYGFVDPRVSFSAGDYVRAAAPLLHKMKAQGRLAVFVGGTGLYFKALTEGLVDIPELPGDVSAAVAALAPADLHASLMHEDPEGAKRLSPSDAPRLQRALAVKRGTGRTLSEWQRLATAPVIARGRWSGCFLDPDRETLYRRIDRRFTAMMDSGALEEARFIRSLGLPPNRGIMKAHGMPHLLRLLEGEIYPDEAVRLGRQDTRNYAKRQLTWARRFMKDWRWIAV